MHFSQILALPGARCCLKTGNYMTRIARCYSAQQLDVTKTHEKRNVPNASGSKIIVPNRKKRDELSVLRALSSTVQRDTASPHYKYFDDPFLTPTSGLDKKSFALAKASGQRAARYVLNKFPSNFAYDTSAPTIEAFIPPFGPHCSVDSIEGLKERLELRLPVQAYESYNKLVNAGVVIETELVEDLLGLLCMYNSSDPPESPLSDELCYLRDIVGHDQTKKFKKEWKDEGAAETLFKELKEPSVTACCYIIRGRAKYFEAERAYDLFNQLRDKKSKIDVKTYNALLRICSFLKDSSEARWVIAQDILRDMAVSELSPDLETFNAVLYVLSRSNRNDHARRWTMNVLNEMKLLEIEPSLTSWYHVLQVFYITHDSQSRILYDIVEHLSGKELQLTAVTDYDFFYFAMSKCAENVKDMQLAYKLDALLHSGNNASLLGDNFREAFYHTQFLRMLCTLEQIDTCMMYYDRLVPHVYSPTFGLLENILIAIELNEGYQYLPRIWSDMAMFQYQRKPDLIEKLLSVMVKKKPDDPKLLGLYVNVVESILALVEADKLQGQRMTNPLVLTGRSIGDMALILLQADNFEKAWTVLNILIQNRQKTNGFPAEDALVSMADACIARKDAEKTIQTLSLMSDFGYPKLDDLVSKVKDTLELTDHQRSHLGDLL